MEPIVFKRARRYWASFVLIALATLASYLLFANAIASHDAEATRINIAGRQRMLSQRIASQIRAYELATDRQTRQEALDELDSALALFERSHRGLLDGDAALGIPAAPEEIRSYYIDQSHLDARVNDWARDIHTWREEEQQHTSASHALAKRGSALLAPLDTAVGLFEAYSNSQLERIEHISYTVMLLVFMLLLVELGFIFEPMRRELEARVLGLREAQTELSRQHAQLQCILEQTGDVVLTCDARGALDTVRSRSADDVLEDASLEAPFWERVGGVSKQTRALLSHMFEMTAGRAGAVITRIIPVGARFYEVDVCGVDGAQSTRALVVWRDITEAQLERDAQETSRIQAAFVSRVNHKLRTPLNAIVGYAEIIEEEELIGGEGRPFLDAILTAGCELRDTVDNVVELTRAQNETMRPRPTVFSIAKLFEELEACVRPDIERRGNTIQIDSALSKSNTLHDRAKLRHILLNLLSNAAKFTTAGTIKLIAREESDASKTHHLIFEVSDTGAGMADNTVLQLFSPFKRATHGAQQGFGLEVCHEMAQILGGTLTAQTCIGEGSTFTLRLPAFHQPPMLESQPMEKIRRSG